MEIETRDLQLALLEMMKSFHQACVEHNLHYYMLGGTCLGAIRHSGFIPWDDDMDVGMPRKDYDLFCKMASSILPQNLVLRYYQNTKESPFHFVKLVNARTTLIEKNYQNYIEGIYIDVFPLDEIERFGFFAKMRAKRIRFNHALIMNHYYTGPAKKGLKNVFLHFSKLVSMKRVHKSLERLMTKEKGKETVYLCNYLGAWKDREIIPKEVFGTPTLYDFEDAQFFGPEDIDKYLTSLYSDYMTPPPVDKRICRHDYFYVDLCMPFSDYQIDTTAGKNKGS